LVKVGMTARVVTVIEPPPQMFEMKGVSGANTYCTWTLTCPEAGMLSVMRLASCYSRGTAEPF